MSDDWRTAPMRPPACSRCGLVEPAPEYLPPRYRHACNRTGVQAMQIGVPAVESIGRAIRDAFAALR